MLIVVSGETDKLLDVGTVWKMGRFSSYGRGESAIFSPSNAGRKLRLKSTLTIAVTNRVR